MSSTPEQPDVPAAQRSDNHDTAAQPADTAAQPAENTAPPTDNAAPAAPAQHTVASADDAADAQPQPLLGDPATNPATPIPPVHPSHAANPAQRRSLLPVVAALAVGALIGGAAGGGVVAALYGGQPGTITSGGSPTTVTVNNPDNATEVTGVVARAMPSIVTLSVSATNGAAGSGSGVILSEDGYVLTNSHVATLDGATSAPSIRVTTHDGRIWNATLVGADPIADLAVVQLEGASGLQPIEFGDSDQLNVGDRAIAIGAPLGLSGTVTNGIVSALNRSITVRSSAVPDAPPEMQDDGDDGDSGDAPPFDFWNFAPPGDSEPQRRPSAPISLSVIQTDAAINPGNSGGALLDSDGRLIGINVAIATAGGTSTAGSIGVGFSIPANFAQRIATELIETGRASHGLLGATVTDASNTATSPVVGALIDQVSPGGPAELAGLRPGDIVTEFNGVPITNRIDLTAQVRVLAGGDDATLVYVRGGQAREVRVTLDELQ